MVERRRITEINVLDVEKRRSPGKHYVYVVSVGWSDGDISIVYRRYSSFFHLQISILDMFTKESGKHNPADRIIPFIPGKIIFGRSHVKEVALKRLDPINQYCKGLVQLPQHISSCSLVIDFFSSRPEDVLPNDTNSSRNGSIHGNIISEPMVLDRYLVVADYSRVANSEIDLVAGETVDIIEKSDTGWWFVSGIEGQGWVPCAYLESSSRQTDAQTDAHPDNSVGADRPYVATHTYSPSQHDELALEQGSIVEVLERSMDGWWLVRSNEREGRVPGTYLSRADTVKARHILKALSNSANTSLPTTSVEPKNKFSAAKITLPAPRNNSPMPRVPSPSPRIPSPSARPASPVAASRKAPPLPTGSRPRLADLLSPPPVNQQKEESPLVNRKPPPPRRGTIPRKEPEHIEEPIYVTSAEFQSQTNDVISFSVGQEVRVVDKQESGWWYVETGGRLGWAPSNYIQKTTVKADAKPTQQVPVSLSGELEAKFNKKTQKTDLSNKNGAGKTRPGGRAMKPLPIPHTSDDHYMPMSSESRNIPKQDSVYANDEPEPPPLPDKAPVGARIANNRSKSPGRPLKPDNPQLPLKPPARKNKTQLGSQTTQPAVKPRAAPVKPKPAHLPAKPVPSTKPTSNVENASNLSGKRVLAMRSMFE